MAEFIGEEKLVSKGEHIVFENKTDSSFDVGMGVIFHKSGIYKVSILGNRIVVSKVTERKTGKWIKMSDSDGEYYCCNNCGEELPRYITEVPTWDEPYPSKYSIDRTDFCPSCGADMRCEEE